MEGYTALRNKDGNDDRWFLNRLRANLTITPVSWWSVTAQGQDSRIFFKSNPQGQNPYTNRTDLRMAFTDFGNLSPTTKDGLTLRVGRQELAYGEERLIGASNWGNVARTFDAAKLIIKHGPLQLDLVSAAVVSPLTRGLSHHLEGNNIHFAYGKWTNPIPGATLDAFVIWRVSRGTGDALSGITHQSRVLSGVRLPGPLPDHWDYTSEWAVQSGSVIDSFGDESIHAFA